MTDTEYRTEFSLWSIMGSSLIVATDVRNMTDIMKEVCDSMTGPLHCEQIS